jgi:hypothetical protein
MTLKQTLPNLKEEQAKFSFRVSIRNTEHFYKIVNWLNKNVGKGRDNWTMEGRVLRILKSGRPASPKIYIFTENYDPQTSLYLSLL